MANRDFTSDIDGRKLPILTLDHKWHKLFAYRGMPDRIKKQADVVNTLLRQQGRYNTELKKLKIIKKNLMDEIVPLMSDATAGDKAADKKIQENKRLIDECNQKIESLTQNQEIVPDEIIEANKLLMLMTMEECYTTMHDNNVVIDDITAWINEIRVELKRQVVIKQENELLNHALYSFMHDIFGPEVIEIFDMKYAPERMITPDMKHGSLAE